MNSMIILLALLLSTTSPVESISMDTVTRVVASRDSKYVALVEHRDLGPVVHILSSKSMKPLMTVTQAQIEEVVEGGHVESVDWSSDSRLLKLEVTDDDVSHATLIIDPLHGTVREATVGGGAVAFGSWSLVGHELYAVPAGDDAEGIFVYNPSTNASVALVSRYRVAARLSVGASALFTKVEETTDDLTTHVLVKIDLKTGRVTVVR